MGFFDDGFKHAVRDAVREVEQQTSAELVVAVRPSSAQYRHIDLTVGASCALAALCVFLYHPEPFAFTFLPLELIVVFALGSLLSVGTPLRRWLASRRAMDAAVDLAASAAFADHRVFSTREQTGILVFVSAYERALRLRPDRGVPVAELPEWQALQDELAAATRRQDTQAWLTSLRRLGPLLSQALPRGADDENELPDELSELGA